MQSSKKLSPDTEIVGLDGHTVLDYWSWAHSDVLMNTQRSLVAEYFVSVALNATAQPRAEWVGHDVTFRGQKIEVKSSAYLQSWRQEKPSIVIFDIAKRAWTWDPESNTDTQISSRIADAYVFCLFTEYDRAQANVLDVGQWEFYVLSTKKLDAAFGDQKSIGLTSLRKCTQPLMFSEITAAVDSSIAE